MTTWAIEARGEATEHYEVVADTEEEARRIFADGDCGQPFYCEVNGIEIVRIEAAA